MRKLATLTAAIALALGFASSGVTGQPNHFFESLVIASSGGSVPVGGVLSTGNPFLMDKGEAKIDVYGNLKVEVEGLRRASDGALTADEVFVSLVCNGSGGNIVASTASFPFDGDATIEVADFFDDPCAGPVILIRRNGVPGGDPTNTKWLAISGF